MKLRALAFSSVTVLATLLVAPAGPAMADASCPNGKLCAWNQPDYNGTKQVESLPLVECIQITLPGGARSAKNRSGHTVQFFTGTNCALDGTLTAVLLQETQNPNFPASYSFLSPV